MGMMRQEDGVKHRRARHQLRVHDRLQRLTHKQCAQELVHLPVTFAKLHSSQIMVILYRQSFISKNRMDIDPSIHCYSP